MKLHLVRQDLSAKLKADFQQDCQEFFRFSIFILSILPARAKSRFEQDEDWLILSENWGLIIASVTLLFLGWVEHISGYVGFRFTQPNLHFVSSIVQCETQQWPKTFLN